MAEDDEATRFVVKRALSKTGAAVTIHEATNGARAIELLEAHAFDAILTDYRMPHFNGVEVLKRARQLQPHARRVLMSGTLYEPAMREKALDDLADFLFEKPMQGEDWAGLLREGLRLDA